VLLEPDPPDEPFMCGHWVLLPEEELPGDELPEEELPDEELPEEALPDDAEGVDGAPDEAVNPPVELDDVVCAAPVVAAPEVVSAPAASPTPMAPPVSARVIAILLGLRFIRTPFFRCAVVRRLADLNGFCQGHETPSSWEPALSEP
jgi:hypothetical protein